MKTNKALPHLVSLILVLAPSASIAKESPLRKAPKAVQEVEWNGAPAYTVDMLTKKDERLSLTLTPPGKILTKVVRPKEDAHVLPLKKSPEGVRRVVESFLKGRLAGGTVEKVSKLDLKSSGHPVYQVSLRLKSGEKKVLRISAPGKVLLNPEDKKDR